LLLLPLLLLPGGCAPGRDARVRDDADEYIAGVQYHDAVGLIKRSAPFRAALEKGRPEDWPSIREEFLARAQERLAQFEEAKRTGMLPMEEDGIDLIQGLAIGKGIFYRFDGIRVTDDGTRAVGVMDVTPDYGEHRLRGLPEGTRVYFMGEPFGTLTSVKLGESDEERSLRVVQSVQLEWSFRWFDAVDVYPEGWAVASIRPVPGSAVMTDLQGVF
jgi:hypothetical protein